MPSVALFRHYFMPRTGRSKWIAGGVSFCLRKETAHQYPEAKIHPDASPQRDDEVVTFHDFSVAGLLPPFSDFFMVVLEGFGTRMRC